MRARIAVLATIAGLSAVMLASIPAGAVEQCNHQKTMVVTGTGTTESKAKRACYRALHKDGHKIYGSAYSGFGGPVGMWCDDDAPQQSHGSTGHQEPA